MTLPKPNITALLQRLARARVFRLVLEQPAAPVKCAACGGSGRGMALQQVDVTTPRYKGASHRAFADALASNERINRMAIQAGQGICLACGGAGVVIPRKATV